MGFRLVFRGNVVMGGGSDESGAFSMVGEVNPDQNLLHLEKHYLGLRVDYDGPWNGSFVCGPSTIRHGQFHERGYFEIWPAEEELPMDSFAKEQEVSDPEILSLPAPARSSAASQVGS